MGVNFNPSFNHLPTELQVTIFSLLPEKDLGMTALVSKPWKQLAEDSFLWKKLFFRRWSNLTQIKTSRFGWKKIYKKKYVSGKLRSSFSPEHFHHQMHKLPLTGSPEILELKVKKDLAFLKMTAGTAQLYKLNRKTGKVIFDNLKDKHAHLIHWKGNHLHLLTTEGYLYRWKDNEPRAKQALCFLGAFEQAYFEQNFLLLILPERKKIKVINIATAETHEIKTSFAYPILCMDCRDNQALIHCVDGSLYLLKDLGGYFTSLPADQLISLEGKIIELPLKELCQFDDSQVMMLWNNGSKRGYRVWNTENGSKIYEGELEPLPSDKYLKKNQVKLTVCDYNQSQLVVGFSDGTIACYESANGKFIREKPRTSRAVRFLQVGKEYCITAANPPYFFIIDSLSLADQERKDLHFKRPGEVRERISVIRTFYSSKRGLASCDTEGWLEQWNFDGIISQKKGSISQSNDKHKDTLVYLAPFLFS
ncbi:hypothetical protein DB42_AC00330 [Neochlamydia sp. EPS4]|uniref:F-box protein n=1 Tax=Neochlamydia sp. EPS4 TaxID=1478175 RepID=UPI0005833D8B|nr:F-box protein [Neochlamydia sp. EPS4]KIC75427.1 hypothetical protein DB42_AC00330 [Neochlamydia sp. EPS4]